VAGRCCALLGSSPLDDELAASRAALAETPPESMPAARAAASDLALRAASGLLVSVGSRGVALDDHAQRLAREALFLLVFGSRACRWRAGRGRAGRAPRRVGLGRPSRAWPATSSSSPVTRRS